MRCPTFRERGFHCRCMAVEAGNIPTLHERESYRWKEDDFHNCPTLNAFLQEGQLDEGRYVDVWLTPDPATLATVARPGVRSPIAQCDNDATILPSRILLRRQHRAVAIKATMRRRSQA